MSSKHPSPALVLALAALFFALGGSALAVGRGGRAALARCSAGTVRGTAHVDASQAFPDRYTIRGVSGAYNCARRGVQAKRVDVGVYDVRFSGNPGSVAVATPTASQPLTIVWSRQADGAFRVFVRGLGGNAVEAGFALTVA